MKRKIRNIFWAILGMYVFAFLLEGIGVADFGIFENFIKYNLFAAVIIHGADVLNNKTKEEDKLNIEFV